MSQRFRFTDLLAFTKGPPNYGRIDHDHRTEMLREHTKLLCVGFTTPAGALGLLFRVASAQKKASWRTSRVIYEGGSAG